MGGSNKASILHWPPDVSTIGDGAATVDSQDTVPSSSTGVSLKNPPSAGSDPIVLFQLYHAKLTDLDNAPMVHMRLSQLLDPAYLGSICIPLLVKILSSSLFSALSDSFDLMTYLRPYFKQLSKSLSLMRTLSRNNFAWILH
jgi:hypothetical protein